ncbi:MAG: hypothetical protein LBF42_03940 [Puniceicoccales bacterium]|jgi:hypothetical protein|nr:hypothetical protein [Puniceicoccales bacterium]
MKQNFDKNSDRRLHDLLQIKRLERPREAQWGKFDRCFEQKRLSAIANPKRTFADLLVTLFVSKRLACMMSGICLAVIVTIGIGQGSRCYLRHGDYSFVAQETRPSYVRDDIMCNVENADFKTQFNHVSRGVAYVCDSISSSKGMCER